MDCGDGDLVCQVLTWVFQDNEYATGVLTKWLGEAGVAGWISNVLKEHGEKLIGLAGFSFGVYRWWKYRETILHRRLEEYLRESDRRLLDGQAYVLEALRRPAPGQKFKLPLFAEVPMLSILRERNWDRAPVASNIFNSAHWQLNTAMEAIGRRIETAERSVASLRLQLATAHVLKGAIASAQARRSAKVDTDKDLDALNSFRSATRLPGQEKNLTAKELEAHQLRKLQRLDEARDAYKSLEGLALATQDTNAQMRVGSMAKRYRAEILQALNSDVVMGERRFEGCGAYELLSPNTQNSVLAIRSQLPPFKGWDAVEQGDIHYLTAFTANCRGFWDIEGDQLADAENAYQTAISGSAVRRWPTRKKARLRKAADEGLNRVRAARVWKVANPTTKSRAYDWQWLVSR